MIRNFLAEVAKKLVLFVAIAISATLSFAAFKIYKTNIPPVAEGSCVIIDFSVNMPVLAASYRSGIVLVKATIKENSIVDGEATVSIQMPDEIGIGMISTISYEDLRNSGYINIDCGKSL